MASTDLPTPQSALEPLTQQRLLDLSRTFRIGLRSGRETNARMPSRLGEQLTRRLPTVLPDLDAACDRAGELAAEAIGEQRYQARAKPMFDTDQRFTNPYNPLKAPAEHAPRILELRQLHEDMEGAVLPAYGWQDIPVPPFYPKTAEDRAALTACEDEVIDRLYVLNAERAREEARLGLGKGRQHEDDTQAGYGNDRRQVRGVRIRLARACSAGWAPLPKCTDMTAHP